MTDVQHLLILLALRASTPIAYDDQIDGWVPWLTVLSSRFMVCNCHVLVLVLGNNVCS